MPIDRCVEISEGRIHCSDYAGRGPAVHFLHANGFCGGTYAPFIRHLAGDFRVVASDIRGHGDTRLPVPERIRHWRLFADDLKTFIEAAMTPPVIGMGHSLGAVTTYLAAALYPHLFSRIVLIDPVILPRRYLWMMAALWRLNRQDRMPLARLARRRKRAFSSRKEALLRFSSGHGLFRTWQPAFIDAYLGCALRHSPGGAAELKCAPELEAQIYESVPRDVWTYAGRIRCPVLAVRGEHTDTFLPGPARRLGRHIADCRVVTLPGTGHFLPMEAPEAVAQTIVDWLGTRQ